jgi:prophage regulatory protein
MPITLARQDETKTSLPIDRFLRMKEVIFRCGYSRPTLYRKIQRGEFPAQLSLCGPSATGGAVAWRESEVDAWIESRQRTSDVQNGGAA